MSSQARPFLVVPASPDFARVFDRDLTRIKMAQRARDVGVVVLMPREVQPATLMFAAMMWPNVLRGTGVTRVAIVLHVGSFASAKPLLGSCQRRMADSKIQVEFFHEADVDNGAIVAWAERSNKRRKRVTTDQLVKVCERYAERGDLRNAILALKLAEENAEVDAEADELAALAVVQAAKYAASTVQLRRNGSATEAQGEPPRRETAELPRVA